MNKTWYSKLKIFHTVSPSFCFDIKILLPWSYFIKIKHIMQGIHKEYTRLWLNAAGLSMENYSQPAMEQQQGVFHQCHYWRWRFCHWVEHLKDSESLLHHRCQQTNKQKQKTKKIKGHNSSAGWASDQNASHDTDAGLIHRCNEGFSAQSTLSADSLMVFAQPQWAIAFIGICVHVKNPKQWQPHHCLDMRKYCTHW